ncbi:MAG TPA: hypothetical protein VH878_04250, partial [Thermodesulfobacteriota bacterium]
MSRKYRLTGIAKKFLYSLILVLLIVGVILIMPRFEWYSPTVQIKPDSEYIGLLPFNIEIKDKGRGLKRFTVALTTQKGVYTLIEKDYSEPVKEDNIIVTLDPKKLGIEDGPATLTVTAIDRSYWGFFMGNKTTLSKNVKVDLTPPKLETFSRDHYINFGGSGAVIYRTSDDAIKSGVKIGNYFFPGYKGYFKNPDVYISIFAYPYNLPPDERVVVVAEDAAGNSKEAGFFYILKYKGYRKST